MDFLKINRHAHNPNSAKVSHFVYAHINSAGEMYIGFSSDPAKRWAEHISDSVDKLNRNYSAPFKASLRKYSPTNWKHYLIASTTSEKLARNREAAAILFYKPKLNKRPELVPFDRDYGFQSIDTQVPERVTLNKKMTSTVYGRTNSQRKVALGIIVYENGRKRVKSLKNTHFDAGLYIECARSERAKFQPGQRVTINVALSTKPNGTNYLVAAKTSPLKLVQ
ncbi:hypothetical protein EXU30_04760 [Shewanella maritima]|uniref:GIY-YIG domain-containing protein n=1 Tax=Shewanella maritima TaxID=2520507 RepID=A0A411PEX8_9GAMM|nr:GIY-YIG nuclease family protein [Shewanella maritima]QBF82093.1 hypothetical protein EXU30_04760 [Shewanella maritima]